ATENVTYKDFLLNVTNLAMVSVSQALTLV
ncbi:hypothetical protein ABH892_005479, partial [Paenibacillus sp. RC254]